MQIPFSIPSVSLPSSIKVQFTREKALCATRVLLNLGFFALLPKVYITGVSLGYVAAKPIAIIDETFELSQTSRKIKKIFHSKSTAAKVALVAGAVLFSIIHFPSIWVASTFYEAGQRTFSLYHAHKESYESTDRKEKKEFPLSSTVVRVACLVLALILVWRYPRTKAAATLGVPAGFFLHKVEGYVAHHLQETVNIAYTALSKKSKWGKIAIVVAAVAAAQISYTLFAPYLWVMGAIACSVGVGAHAYRAWIDPQAEEVLSTPCSEGGDCRERSPRKGENEMDDSRPASSDGGLSTDDPNPRDALCGEIIPPDSGDGTAGTPPSTDSTPVECSVL